MITTHLGRVDYATANALLAAARYRVTHGGRDELMLVHHDPLVTLPAQAGPVDRDLLSRLGVEVVETGDGGPATWHGPGQVVGYPIVDLRRAGRALRTFVTALGAILVETCGGLGLAGVTHRGDRDGVYVDGRGLGSLHVGAVRGVTTGGFALNVSNTLDGFAAIAPRGSVTTVSRELGEVVDVSHAEGIVAALARGVIA